MHKSIATPPILNRNDCADVIDFNVVVNAKSATKGAEKITIINDGIIVRPRRSFHTESFSEGYSEYNTPYLNNVGLGNGGQENGDGEGGLGDGGCGSGKGTISKGFGHNGKRTEFTLVKSSNISISIFNGSNFNTHPYLFFYKAIKCRIYTTKAKMVSYSWISLHWLKSAARTHLTMPSWRNWCDSAPEQLNLTGP